MVKARKYSIDMARLRLGDAQGFDFEEACVLCRSGGRFISGRFDSGAKNSEWGRLCLDIRTVGYCEYKITVFASNRGEPPSNVEWQNKSICRCAENLPELLLHKAQGRYLWFCVEVQGEASLHGGAVYTFGETFEDYLPQLYSMGRESFTHRYLSIFFTAYRELSENIDGFGKNLDPKSAPEHFLPIIAGWLGLGSLCGLLSPAELRVFLPYGRYLSRYRGTRRAILLICELLTGMQPVLLEQMRVHENTAAPYAKTYGRLYGEKGDFVLLIFFGMLDGGTCARLQRLTDMFMPVGGAARLVVRQSSVVLDGYTYLDYNARFMAESGGAASSVKADEGFALL